MNINKVLRKLPNRERKKYNYHSSQHRSWRKEVLRLACWTCVECGDFANVADHIKPVERYPNLALDINNGQAMCETCHAKKSQSERKDR